MTKPDGPWPCKKIRDWTHFTELADRITLGPVGRASYVARGQADAAWPLQSTMQRTATRILTHEEFISLEQRLVREFVAQAHIHIRSDVLGGVSNQLQKWAVMQHHGAPTRLLDWSESLYVAAYYAVDSYWRADGAIWLFHSPTLKMAMKKLDPRLDDRGIAQFFSAPDAPMAVWPCYPDTMTPRMAAQQGLFTVPLNPLASHEAAIAHLVDPLYSEAEVIRKWIVPAELKPVFLRRLRAMNITANALFPGVDGLGRSITELVRLEAAAGEGIAPDVRAEQ